MKSLYLLLGIVRGNFSSLNNSKEIDYRGSTAFCAYIQKIKDLDFTFLIKFVKNLWYFFTLFCGKARARIKLGYKDYKSFTVHVVKVQLFTKKCQEASWEH